MLVQESYSKSSRTIWLIAFVCALPLLLHALGINFGIVNRQLDLGMISRLIEFENQQDLKQILRGRYVHTIFVSFSIAISLLTIILAFIDFRIKGELSTPIVGVALFCSGLFYSFHVLVADDLIHIPNHQFYLISFTWFFCRLFHALVLILGVSIFLIRWKFLEEITRKPGKLILFITVFFVLITCLTIALLFTKSHIPRMVFPYHNIARPYDLIPLPLYLISAFYILPKFHLKYPSVFSYTLFLSMIPAISTQLYMAFGSDEMFDNNFNISHFTTAFTYFIPFIGLSLNYLQTNKNEKRVIRQLNYEAHERALAEKTLSGVLDSSLSSIMALRAVRGRENNIMDFEWTLVNPATEQLFKLEYKLLQGRRLTDQLPSAVKEGWIDMFIHVVDTGDTLNHEYFSDHFGKWFLMVAVKLEDGLALTISDISKRKNALQELMSAEKLAATGRLARTIAHEVRNPLTNINLSLEHMDENVTGDVKMYLDIARRNSERINQLITELMNSSKPAELLLSPQPVSEILNQTLELAMDRIHLKNIRLEKKFDEEILIGADIEKIKTALINLVINAIEAMEEGEGILKVSSVAKEDMCLIEVEDNGTGIDPENLKRLFEPFFSKKSRGMGLGLTATQNIVLAHEGTIQVESTPGKGTRFIIAFPLLKK